MFYDDDCGLCAKCVSWFAARAPGAEFVAQAQASRSVVVVVDGVELEEGAAVAALFSEVGGVWKVLGSLLARRPLRGLTSIVYRVVAGNRLAISRFLGWEGCRVTLRGGSPGARRAPRPGRE